MLPFVVARSKAVVAAPAAGSPLTHIHAHRTQHDDEQNYQLRQSLADAVGLSKNKADAESHAKLAVEDLYTVLEFFPEEIDGPIKGKIRLVPQVRCVAWAHVCTACVRSPSAPGVDASSRKQVSLLS